MSEETRLFQIGLVASTLLLASSSWFLGGAIEIQLAHWNQYSILLLITMGLVVSGEILCLGTILKLHKAEILERISIFNELPKAEFYNSRYRDSLYCASCARKIPQKEVKNGFHVDCGKMPRHVPRYIKSSTRAKLRRFLDYEVNPKEFLEREINLNSEVNLTRTIRRLLGRHE